MSSSKWALVTGASGGIGRALCHEIAADGVNIILVARDQAELQKVASNLEDKFKIKTIVITSDLSQDGAPAKLLTAVNKYNVQVDYLVNNAGFGGYGAFSATDLVSEKAMINLNITALTELCKLFLPAMAERGSGRILNVASTAAFLPGPYMAVYFATKAYVLHFSEAINEELQGSGVTVTALCPGPTATHFAATASASNTSIFRGKLPTATSVAEFGYRAMKAGRPVAVHRLRNRLMVVIIRFVPRGVLTRFVGKAQR